MHSTDKLNVIDRDWVGKPGAEMNRDFVKAMSIQHTTTEVGGSDVLTVSKSGATQLHVSTSITLHQV